MTDREFTEHFTCLECGYPGLMRRPRSPRGGGSDGICPSCGFEFGVTDDDEGYTYEQWRAFWIAARYPRMRAAKRNRPKGWDPIKQLARLVEKLSDTTTGSFQQSAPTARTCTTEDHLLWNAGEREWQAAQDIDPGEAVLSDDGDFIAVDGLDWSTRSGGIS